MFSCDRVFRTINFKLILLSGLVIAATCWLGLRQVPQTFAQTETTEQTPDQLAPPAESTPPAPSFFKGTVTKIIEERRIPAQDRLFYTQRLQVKRQDTNETIELNVGTEYQPLNQSQLLTAGKQVILTEQISSDGTSEYVIADVYRLPTLTWLLIGFFIMVLLVARFQGLSSILGMVISLGMLTLYIVPSILHGDNPVVVTLVGGLVIASVTVYLSHGFKISSHIALLSMMITLLAVGVLSLGAVKFAHLAGLGSEEAYFLQFGQTAQINLQGLLLGGIMLGALGILDDICIAQISTVFQLKSVNQKLTFEELYQRGLAVGKDHVASLVNTLVLAYAGANLPLFLLFTINKDIPLWFTLNNEIIAEEVVRTLVGSMGLVLAVPIATVLASWAVTKFDVKLPVLDQHAHHHH